MHASEVHNEASGPPVEVVSEHASKRVGGRVVERSGKHDGVRPDGRWDGEDTGRHRRGHRGGGASFAGVEATVPSRNASIRPSNDRHRARPAWTVGHGLAASTALGASRRGVPVRFSAVPGRCGYLASASGDHALSRRAPNLFDGQLP